MSESPPSGSTNSATVGKGPGWIRRHKVWTAIIAVTALATMGSFNHSDSAPSASSPASQVTDSPSPADSKAAPAPGVTALARPSDSPPVVIVAKRKPATAPPTRAATTKPAAKSALTCVASVSNAYPAQYSTVDVYVIVGRANTGVSAVAHYKSTDTAHTAVTASNGKATIPYRISRASVGYTVVVDVSVAGGPSCQTSFTPQ